MTDSLVSEARVQEIQARVEKATKGPWAIEPCSDTDERRDVVADYKMVKGKKQAHWIAELDAQMDFDSDVEGQLSTLEANAEFIAHAREDIPYLLAALTAHHEALDTLRQALQQSMRDCESERDRRVAAQEAIMNNYMPKLKAAEAECATLRAQLAVVSSEPQTP